MGQLPRASAFARPDAAADAGADARASWAHTRVPPAATRSNPQRSHSPWTRFSPKPPQIRVSRSDHTAAARVLHLQAHHRSGELNAHDDCTIGRAAVAHTVGHQLRHDQQRVRQDQRRNPTTQTPHHEPRRAGRPRIERQAHLKRATLARRAIVALASDPFVGGPQLGVLRPQRHGPAAQVRRHRSELLDHARLAPTGQAQAVKLRTRTA